MKKSFLLLSLVLALCFASFSLAADGVAQGTYADETAQGEWYLTRTISSFRINGVRISHMSKVQSVFSQFVGRQFTYELLSELQRDLYSTGYFESFDPQVDMDEDGNIVLVFDFVEIPVIRSISFVAPDISKPLSYSEGQLRQKSGISIGESRTKREIEAGALSLKEFYVSEGRPDTQIEVGLYKDEQAGEYNVVYTISEGIAKRVGRIVFEGNDSVSSQTLLRNVETKVSTSFGNGYYIEDDFRQDVRMLSDYYRKSGYKDVSVSGPEVEEIDVGRNDGAQYVSLKYTIDEGRRWVFGSISFSGNTLFNSERLASKLTFAPGDVYDYDRCLSDSESVLMDYYDEGYIYASSSVRIDQDNQEGAVNVTIQIDEQSQCFVESVAISGVKMTGRDVFMRELTFAEGDIFSREKIQQSLQNIYNTGLIKNLDYNLSPGSDRNHLILELIVEEAQAMDVTFGMTFGGTEGGFPLSFVASFNNKNFLGRGDAISAGVNISTDYQALTLSFGSSWFGSKRWSNSFSLSFDRSVKKNALQRSPDSDFQIGRNGAFPFGYSSYEDFQAYEEAVPSLSYLMRYDMYRISFGYNTGYTWIMSHGRLSLSGGLSLGLNHAVYDPNEYMPFEYLVEQYRQRWRFSNRLYVGITWDGRDFVENTTKGYMASQSITYAGGILGGLSNYIRTTTMLSGYLTLLKTSGGVRPTALVGSITTSLSMMLPQFYSTDLDSDRDTSWKWHDPKLGATRSEMLYIDGMRVARGHRTVYDISFMWDSILEISYPIVNGVVNAEVFTSMTAVSKQLESLSSNIVWYGAVGAGVKLKISGFPLGVYLVGDYKIKAGEVSWVDGGLFNYIHPVLSISVSMI